ncbi:MAG: Allophanate hydrolase subunit 2 [Candidatus Bathyarchaeota archaeon BA1]|nr:MAG: Allophanate hydrolase subunit 2 [Candidatus Bathyarchaeota archaeon BA1]
MIGAFPSPLKAKLSLPEELIPQYSDELTVGVILGPQADMFTEKGVETFLSSAYIVTTEADRMGYRLEGPVIEHKVSPDIISDAIPLGAVQVPGNGKPIIMMADAQTTGGYAKIAVVTTPSLSRLGQARPGHVLHFSKVSLSQARTQLLEYQKNWSQMEKRLIRQ